MEQLLKKLIEQNERLIQIAEQQDKALDEISRSITRGFDAIEAHLTLSNSSGDIELIRKHLESISSDVGDVADQINRD